MRIYLPALASDLLDDRPPIVEGFTAVPVEGMDAEAVEVLEDDAQTEAALASLARLRDSPGAMSDGVGGALAPHREVRVVLAADAPGTEVAVVDPADTTSHVAIVAPGQLRWSDVAAILVDGPEAAPEVRAVVAADDQDSADAAVAALWARPLQWFDISERDALVATWRGSAGTQGLGGTRATA